MEKLLFQLNHREERYKQYMIPCKALIIKLILAMRQ